MEIKTRQDYFFFTALQQRPKKKKPVKAYDTKRSSSVASLPWGERFIPRENVSYPRRSGWIVNCSWILSPVQVPHGFVRRFITVPDPAHGSKGWSMKPASSFYSLKLPFGVYSSGLGNAESSPERCWARGDRHWRSGTGEKGAWWWWLVFVVCEYFGGSLEQIISPPPQAPPSPGPPFPPPPRFIFFFKVKISSCTPIPLFRPDSVYSGTANQGDCERVFLDELRVSSFSLEVPTLCLNSRISPLRLFRSRVYARFSVTCHLQVLHDERGLFRATAVTQGWNGHRIRVSTESWLWKRKFSRRSCRRSNRQPSDHESVVLSTELLR